MPAIFRFAAPDDTQFVSAIETSAAQTVRMIDELSWPAQSPPMYVERHSQLNALSTCWVALGAEIDCKDPQR